MQLSLVLSKANKHELTFSQYLEGKLAAMGYQVQLADNSQWQAPQAEVMVVVLDGRPLPAVAVATIGAFRLQANQAQVLPKKLLVAYQLSAGSDDDLKAAGLFDHIATTELNLIYCLKDYLYISHKHGQR